jgi:N-acetylglucosaminyldiphosphoundecaprenol N-acetyl-beta-D-mannosaminyltransferase
MENADMSIPDGVPLLWLGRLKGLNLKKRCGIEEIMLEAFELSHRNNQYTHYFYGNTEEVLNTLRDRLKKEYPNLKIAGMRSPPFRPLTAEEQELELKTINDTNPDFLWVSLGCPKQEIWLYNNKDKLNAVVGGGSGAVFNFLSGHTLRAPNLVRYSGMEWLMRLILEPKRLFKRYVIGYPKLFLYYWPKMLLGRLCTK